MSASTNPTRPNKYVQRLRMVDGRPELARVLVADNGMVNAEKAYRVASEERRFAVQRAVAAGATHQEVADVLGCSRVYVTQLVNQQGENQ